MNEHQNAFKTNKLYSRIELVLFLSDPDNLNRERLKAWSHIFSDVTAAGYGARPEGLPEQVEWLACERGEDRATYRNRVLAHAAKDWILFLEDDEIFYPDSFPEPGTIGPEKWVPALIRTETEKTGRKQYYQMRLVYKGGGNTRIFEGKNLPDCTRHITENGIRVLQNRPLVIDRKSAYASRIDFEDEMSVRLYSPRLYLFLGEKYLREARYGIAAAQYRKVLKIEKLLPFDRLAAVNGLASCFAEQFKWDQALTLAEESISAEPQQRLPYLIRFRIFELNKQWEQACRALVSYYDRLNEYTRANFDKAISGEETLHRMADMAQRAGLQEQALAYLEELYKMKNEVADYALLRTLLLLSVELDQPAKAALFFGRIYDDVLPDTGKLNEKQEKELNDFLSMFMKRGWYEFTSDVYEQLYRADPENGEYRRRLIVSLSKTRRIEQARKLVAGSV